MSAFDFMLSLAREVCPDFTGLLSAFPISAFQSAAFSISVLPWIAFCFRVGPQFDGLHFRKWGNRINLVDNYGKNHG
jgi:hypothetical protein